MGSSASSRNILYTILGMVGLAGWLLYILACLPTVGWSPDSSKILFAYERSDMEETGVALYDRTTGATRRLFVSSDPWGAVLPGWTQDGKYAIVYEVAEGPCSDETLNIFLIPVGSDEPLRLLAGGENRTDFSVLPPQQDGDLFLGGSWLMRLDLATGEVEAERDLGGGVAVLAAGHGRILYVGQELTSKWREAHQSPQAVGQAESWTIEIGELEPEELTLQPLFELDPSDLEPFAIDELYGALWVDPSGNRIALLGEGEERSAIVLCSPAGLEHVITPQIPFENYRLATPQWSLDGKTLYAGIATPSDEAEWLQFSIVETPVSGGPARLVPIVRLRGEVSDLDRESAPLMLPTIALSPDGSMIAAAATIGDPEDDLVAENPALFLVDLRDPQRPVSELRPSFLRSNTGTD